MIEEKTPMQDVEEAKPSLFKVLKKYEKILVWGSSVLLVAIAVFLYVRLYHQVQKQPVKPLKVAPLTASPLSGRNQNFLNRLVLVAQSNAGEKHQATVDLNDLRLALQQIDKATRTKAVLVSYNPDKTSEIAACFTPQGGVRVATRSGNNSAYGYAQINALNYPILSGLLPATVDPFSCS